MRIKQEFRNFMNNKFSGMELKKPLFYSWNLGLRFDLQVEFKNPVYRGDDKYFKSCQARGISLFESCFEPNDKIFLIVNEYRRRKQKIKFGNYAFKQITGLRKDEIEYRKLKQRYEPGDKFDVWNQAIIKTSAGNVSHKNIIIGLSNTDFWPRSPRIDQEIFMVNLNKELIFNMYDDRGLDVIGANSEIIKSIFDKHNEWILDYDRKLIEKQLNIN